MAITAPHSDSPLLTKPEAAQYLRMTVRSIEMLVSAGEITPTRLGLKGGRVLFHQNELDRYVAARTPVRIPAMVGALATA